MGGAHKYLSYKLANLFKEPEKNAMLSGQQNCWMLGRFWEQTTVYQKKEGHGHWDQKEIRQFKFKERN